MPPDMELEILQTTLSKMQTFMSAETLVISELEEFKATLATAHQLRLNIEAEQKKMTDLQEGWQCSANLVLTLNVCRTRQRCCVIVKLHRCDGCELRISSNLRAL